ncbi:hypothetical protein UFOVP191_65 [uncultured Caudovirales phage]|uniref:Uncharacterized protein n=1 Tax=uncultured Caudovirales phage TaxID=2100421 RepID=A0A6J7WJ59_9CAUD|nr:hypothetical protein UFOVP191_65 [uncultured Caudovirales phage]
MARVLLPPKTETMVDDDSFPTLNWLSFFEGLSTGDLGAVWTPTFTGLTEVGTATKTGVYYRITNKLAFFRIVITPATNTTAVAGTTYCNNFPLSIAAQGLVATISSYTAAVSGATTDKRIYTASWAAVTTPITLIGLLEVS